MGVNWLTLLISWIIFILVQNRPGPNTVYSLVKQLYSAYIYDHLPKALCHDLDKSIQVLLYFNYNYNYKHGKLLKLQLQLKSGGATGATREFVNLV